MDIKDKIAVVVGASGGIGREISKALAEEGAYVFLVARRKSVLDALKRDIEEKGGWANVYLADVTNEKSVAKLSSYLKDNFGKVDLLFNAQGIGIYKKFPEVTYDDWKKQMAVNVDSVFLVTQKLLPLLEKSKKAFVISTGSGMGKVAVARRSPYCASKFALRGFVLSLAKEYRKTNVHFVHLVLGSVLTSFGPLTLEEKKEKLKRGKKYLDPVWLSHYIVTKIKNDTLEAETTIYPKHYFEESKKGKT